MKSIVLSVLTVLLISVFSCHQIMAQTNHTEFNPLRAKLNFGLGTGGSILRHVPDGIYQDSHSNM